MITLLTGATIDEREVHFNPDNYSFVYRGLDITQQIRNADKRNFDGFDNTFYNELLYVQKYQREHGGALPPTVGSDSVWYNFVNQIATDPFGAPLESLDNFVNQVLDSSGVRTVLIIGGIALVLIILAKR